MMRGCNAREDDGAFWWELIADDRRPTAARGASRACAAWRRFRLWSGVTGREAVRVDGAGGVHNGRMQTISWDEFERVELRVGRIVSAEPFPQARKPAYILQIDFGPEIGIKRSSAQITHLYQPDALIGRLIVGVVNFPPKQIGPIRSECLVTGFHTADGSITLCVPDKDAPLGAKLC
jgi:tRNA-binding protein